MTTVIPTTLRNAEDPTSSRYSFTGSKQKFDQQYAGKRVLDITPVTVDGKVKENIRIRNSRGEPLEEYYKWQFISSIINSGLVAKDYIGTEVRFPKGNKASTPLKIDAAIFDDATWIDHYRDYWTQKPSENPLM